MRIVSGTFSVSHRPVGQVIFARRLAILTTGDRITSMSDQPIEIPARAEVVNSVVPRVSKGRTGLRGSQGLEGSDEMLWIPKSRGV